jgi:p-aminobenzoyl-glutamate transporter AbgT
MKKIEKILFISVFLPFILLLLLKVYESIEFEKNSQSLLASVNLNIKGLLPAIMLMFFLGGWIARGYYERLFKSNNDKASNI